MDKVTVIRVIRRGTTNSRYEVRNSDGDLGTVLIPNSVNIQPSSQISLADYGLTLTPMHSRTSTTRASISRTSSSSIAAEVPQTAPAVDIATLSIDL